MVSYEPTFKPSYALSSRNVIETHLAPYFGSTDLRNLREADLLGFVKARLDAGLRPNTVRNALSCLRRVVNLHMREGTIVRNPAARIGELMRRVDRRTDLGVAVADSWSREELRSLLAIARDLEPRFYPILAALMFTGARVGEVLGLSWDDLDFARSRIHIRRAWVRGRITTPKSGRARFVVLSPALATLLMDVMAAQRRETLALGWRESPGAVFATRAGTRWDDSNLRRVWGRVRRRAKAVGFAR